jgi:hypothetical protein
MTPVGNREGGLKLIIPKMWHLWLCVVGGLVVCGVWGFIMPEVLFWVNLFWVKSILGEIYFGQNLFWAKSILGEIYFG